ncbi:hypothetical protein CEUSTIGMA_g13238.t1 [Chlamydomonas eustigma]|uniref:RWP-RK domain-containing protein n=1 Tax=Chlamydomonas eustigma TaxID=1157962 RepID=A0A250XS27_9CHLO|nr:hypothetical protein CEUSTIGMA_g13238.t1 [Chlamydomonas eustigma]|eukprot:GAX85823.1 hypothetical protein CEUSTIGMA_g13238.t1 [Chlamydomonas eustigma]
MTNDCAVLCTHVLRVSQPSPFLAVDSQAGEAATTSAAYDTPSVTEVRVQLHEASGGKMHISIQQCSGNVLINNLILSMEGVSTEYVAEFFASYLLALDPQGRFKKEYRKFPEVTLTTGTGATGTFRSCNKCHFDELIHSCKRYIGVPISYDQQAAGQRTNDRSMEVLSQYFSLPINDASKALGICSTSLKKICRKLGLLRWPYRKVKSMDNKLAKAAANKPTKMPH